MLPPQQCIFNTEILQLFNANFSRSSIILTPNLFSTSHTISQPQRTPSHLSSPCHGSGPPKNHKKNGTLLKSCRKTKSFRSKWIFFKINKPTIWNLWKCQEEFSDRMYMLTNWDIIHFISSISGYLLIKEHVSLGVLRTCWIVMSWWDFLRLKIRILF